MPCCCSSKTPIGRTRGRCTRTSPRCQPQKLDFVVFVCYNNVSNENNNKKQAKKEKALKLFKDAIDKAKNKEISKDSTPMSFDLEPSEKLIITLTNVVD